MDLSELLFEINLRIDSPPWIKIIDQEIRRSNSLVELRELWLKEYDTFKILNPNLQEPELSDRFDKIFNKKYLREENGIRIWKI